MAGAGAVATVWVTGDTNVATVWLIGVTDGCTVSVRGVSVLLAAAKLLVIGATSGMVWVAGELDDVGRVASGALVTAASATEGAAVAASRVLVIGATVVEGPFEIGSPVGCIKRPVAVAGPVVVCDTVGAGLLWAALVAGEA